MRPLGSAVRGAEEISRVDIAGTILPTRASEIFLSVSGRQIKEDQGSPLFPHSPSQMSRALHSDVGGLEF